MGYLSGTIFPLTKTPINYIGNGLTVTSFLMTRVHYSTEQDWTKLQTAVPSFMDITAISRLDLLISEI